MRPFLPVLAVTAALAAPLCAADLRYPDDAALHALQFVDANEGWAVGDVGVIWHSIDGGRTWERQPTGLVASLRGLHFLNPFTGWVVGREELPEGGSVGVVLATHDGGLKWERLCAQSLPGLQRIRFFDDKSGIAVGDGSDACSTGVFSTSDGGRSWKSQPGPRCPGWLAADFQDAQNGALVGAWGRLATLRQGVLAAASVELLNGRSVLSVQIAGKSAAAVGQGGLVLTSKDSAGEKWGFADLKLSPEVEACLDFQAVACRGKHIWVAGRPGSVIFHSDDSGATWQATATGRSLPLRGLFFLNEQRGWAVGELGLVLATTDGGKTWQMQREGGQRAAVLCIHARPNGVPFDTVALLGGEDGYLMTALQVVAPDPASAPLTAASAPQRLATAMRRSAGAAGEALWQFPLPQHLGQAEPREVMAAWDKLHGGAAADQVLRQLVLALRIWQPEVVLTDGKGTSDGHLEELVTEAVQEAFQRAADAKAFPEQIEQLGLKPWQAQKLYARCPDQSGAQVAYESAEPRPRLQASARDFAAPAAALFSDTPLPAQAFYHLLASRLDGATSHSDLMQGINLGQGGTARRRLDPLDKIDPDIEKAVHARRNLQALAEAPPSQLTDPDRLLGQIAPTLATMPDEQAVAAAAAIAAQFARNGQWTLAREAYLLLVDRYPAHPLAAEAYRWLVRYNSSSEARHRQEQGNFIAVTEAAVQQTQPNTEGTIHTNTESVEKQQLTLLGDRKEARAWYEGSLQIEPRLQSFGRVFVGDPAIQFCLQSARRNLGDFQSTQEWYKRFAAAHADGPWHDAAMAELWLANRTGPAPKPVVFCRQSETRPLLDGSFDDTCWQGLPAMKLKNAVGDTTKEYPTEAWLAYDNDFLYVAVRCKHPADRHVDPVPKRKRDEDLRAFDRVSLLFDLDRDYSTSFRLEIDQRGCLCEDCWGDKTWNPRWFVAIRSDATSWQAEAAIPLTELTGEPITINRAWACNVVRILPGRGVQAWSAPADVQPRPEGMGLLIFGDAKAPLQQATVPKGTPPTGN